MEQSDSGLVECWKARARAVSAVVAEAASVDEAFSYALALCESRPPHERLLPEQLPQGEGREGKTLAAPGLPEALRQRLAEECGKRGLTLAEKGLRGRVGGLEVGLAFCAAALADTGTCVVESTDEDVRLATMLPEVSVLLLPQSRILAGSEAAAPLLRRILGSGAPRYLAYISGPSRTADVERVLTLGVHGPLEVHVLLLTSENDVPPVFGASA